MLVSTKQITSKVFQLDQIKLDDIEFFLNSNKNGQKTFRYFKKRSINSIKNHIFTSLYYYDNQIVGYGHLDVENNKTWLGVMVADSFIKKGIGIHIVNDLLMKTKNDVYLSVDKENTSAFFLYEKLGFKKEEEKETYYIMRFKQS